MFSCQNCPFIGIFYVLLWRDNLFPTTSLVATSQTACCSGASPLHARFRMLFEFAVNVSPLLVSLFLALCPSKCQILSLFHFYDFSNLFIDNLLVPLSRPACQCERRECSCRPQKRMVARRLSWAGCCSWAASASTRRSTSTSARCCSSTSSGRD